MHGWQREPSTRMETIARADGQAAGDLAWTLPSVAVDDATGIQTCIASSITPQMNEGRDRSVPAFRCLTERLGRADLARPRALRALLDLERDALAASEAIEVERGLEAVTVEEVFLPVLGRDEAEAAIGNDLLDGTGGHMDLHVFPN